MRKYRGFGLQIVSEIDFPELVEAAFEKADVTISIGEVPHFHGKAVYSADRVSYFSNDEGLLIIIEGIASYYITDGTAIVISPYSAHIEQRSLRTFVLSSAMTGILQQRGRLPMHTAAIVKDQCLTLIAGHSGAGKSTTIAGLMSRHYKVFSDDITILQHGEDGLIYGAATYPMIKLWDQSMQLLDHDAFRDRSFPVMPGMKKYGVFFHNDFDISEYPVKNIIVLNNNGTDTVIAEKTGGARAFELMTRHVYRPVLFSAPEMRALSFRIFSSLAGQADIYSVTRPSLCMPDQLLNIITRLI